MKNLANVMAVMVMIFAMGLMVGCGCGTKNDMNTNEMVDQVPPETENTPETPTEDTIVPDVIEGTDTTPSNPNHRYDENGNLVDENGNIVDENGNIIDDAGNAVGDAIDGAGNIIDDAGNAVGNVMEDIGNGVNNMTDPNTSSATDNAAQNGRLRVR